jgi:hypothetical protein
MEQALQRYALLEHVTDDAPSTNPGGFRWTTSSSTGLATPSRWIFTSWSGNAVARRDTSGSPSRTSFSVTVSTVLFTLMLLFTLLFRVTSINEYYRKFKAMTDGLADLGTPIDDRIIILNILRVLNQRFEHVGSIIQRYSPFLNFLKVQDDLLLEELHMDSTGPPAALTTLYTNIASPATKPPSSTPSRSPYGSNGGISGNRSNYHNKNRNSGNGGGHNDKNSTDGGGCGGSSSQTTAHWFRRLDQCTVADLRSLVARAHDYVPRPRARWTVASAGLRGHTGPLRISRPLVRAAAAVAAAAVSASRPGPKMEPLAQR